jgi:hypothetical protein
MPIIERESCAVTGSNDLEHIYVFSNFPVFMGCTNQLEEMDLKQDMSWAISRSSGLIQLKQLLPLEILYPESHGAGLVGQLWKQHHKEFAGFVRSASPSAVFEIGGSHGILAKEYQTIDVIPWTILEPNPYPVEGCNARFIKGFFDEKYRYSDEFDALVHSHVFEHMYSPKEFMRQVSGFMEVGKKLIFSIPNMQAMLEAKYLNCINFEHTAFITEPYVEYLLSKYGFKIVDKLYFKDDHSIFYSTVRADDVECKPIPYHLYDENRKIFTAFIEHYKFIVADLNKKISLAKKPVFLFGAHIFAQYLIEMGLDCKKIVCLLDNDPNKHGLRLYGTNIQVESPKILAGIDKPLVILKAGVYSEEIKTDILANINETTQFLG